MGFDHEFLLDAVLSATAFHMYARLPMDMQLLDAGYRYHGRAITGHREALATINHSTADALCVASIFIMLMTSKITRQRPAHEPYSPPIQWFRVMNGMGCLIRHSKSFLGDDGIRVLMERTHTIPESYRELSELPLLPDLGDFLSFDNFAFDDNLDQGSKMSRKQFGDAVSRIFSSAIAGASQDLVRYQLLGLAATNNEQFLRLIEQEDALTVIILSHYFTLLRWTGGNWWLQSDLETELCRLASSVPQQHRWAVALQSHGSKENENSILRG